MVEYQGEWLNGKRKGWGRAKYRDGEKFEGQWRAGGREGLGISIYPGIYILVETRGSEGLGVSIYPGIYILVESRGKRGTRSFHISRYIYTSGEQGVERD